MTSTIIYDAQLYIVILAITLLNRSQGFRLQLPVQFAGVSFKCSELPRSEDMSTKRFYISRV